MKMYGRAELQFHEFLLSGEIAYGTYWTAGWVGNRDDLDVVENRNISGLAENNTLVIQLY
jgi:hypothetical protein